MEFVERTLSALERAGFDIMGEFSGIEIDAYSELEDFELVQIAGELSEREYERATATAALSDRVLWILNGFNSWTYGRNAVRKQGWTDFVAHLESLGAVIWWIDRTIFEHPRHVDCYRYPDLLAALYQAHEDAPADLAEIKFNLAAMIKKSRFTLGENA